MNNDHYEIELLVIDGTHRRSASTIGKSKVAFCTFQSVQMPNLYIHNDILGRRSLWIMKNSNGKKA